MILWIHWWNAIILPRPAFSRYRTFLWFATGAAELSILSDNPGVTSIVRSLSLDGKYYDNLPDNFHSSGVNLRTLTVLWTRVELKLFGNHITRVNKRAVIYNAMLDA